MVPVGDMASDQPPVLAGLGRLLDRATTLDERYGLAVTHLIDAGVVDRVAVSLVVDNHLLLVRAGGMGRVDVVRPLPAPVRAHVVERGMPLRAARADGGIWYSQDAHMALHLPLTVGGRVDAVLTAEFADASRAGEADLETLAAAARVISASDAGGQPAVGPWRIARQVSSDRRTWSMRQITPALATFVGRGMAGAAIDAPTWDERVHPDDRDRYAALRQAGMTASKTHRVVYRFRRSDDTWADLQETVLVIATADGGTALHSIVQDVTTPWAADDYAVRELLDVLPGVVAYVKERDPVDGAIRDRFVSQEVEVLTGVPAEAWLREGRSIFELVHPDDLERLRAVKHAARDQRMSDAIEFRIVRHDGVIRWVRTRYTYLPSRLPDGSMIDRWHGVIIDITDRREVEAALVEREARYRLLVEQVPAATLYSVRVDATGQPIQTLYLSPQFETLTGYAIDERPDVGLILEIAPPADQEKIAGLRFAPGHDQATADFRIVHRSGAVRWVRSVSRLMEEDVDGTAIWHGVLTDVTDDRTNEEQRHQKDVRLRAAVEQGSDIVLIISSAPGAHGASLAFHSSSLETILGYGAAELTLSQLSDLVHPDHIEAIRSAFRSVIAQPEGTLANIRVPVLHASGRWVWLEISASNRRQVPEIAGIVITARDVTDQVMAEQAQRERVDIFQKLVEHTNDLLLILDADNEISFASVAVAEFFALGDDRLTGDHLAELIDPSDCEAAIEAIRRVRATPNAVEHLDLRIRNGAGEWRMVSISLANHVATPGIDGVLASGTDVTDVRRAEQRLRDSEERFRALFRHAPDIVLILDPNGVVRFASPSVESALGEPLDRVVGQDFHRRFHREDTWIAADQFDRALLHPQESVSFEARVWQHDGAWVWWELTLTNLLAQPGVAGLVVNARDVTWRKDAEAQLRFSAERFRALVQHGSDLTLLVNNDGVVTYATPSTERILGYEPHELEGRSDFTWVSPADRGRMTRVISSRVAPGEPSLPIVISAWHADGNWRDLEVIATAVERTGSVEGVVINAHDVTDQRTLELQLLHQAFHDPLTGLPNRSLFRDRLVQARSDAEEHQTAYGVIFLDLDEFKLVNDTFGHLAGDQLLRTAGDRLNALARGEYTIARMGGDEFTILLEGISGVAEAEAFAGQVIQHLREPILINGEEVLISPALGITVWQPGDDADRDLLREADVAMYEAKALGHGQRVVYGSGMGDRTWIRLHMHADLHRALRSDQLHVHYQPQVDLVTGRIREFEALIRWEHPVRGSVPPAEFLPLAEETGIIVPLGEHVLRRACQDAGDWNRERRTRGLEPLVIAVNLSPRQFLQQDLVPLVHEVLRSTGLDPSCLRLEITEQVAMADLAATVATMTQLRDLGVKLSIDDFGTGYSGLSHLRQCPFDTIKIDGSYIAAIGEDHADTAILHAVMVFARTLGLQVCAEGIEREEQVRVLRALGCQRGQGFFFSGALPGATVAAMLRSDPLWSFSTWNAAETADGMPLTGVLA